MSFSGNMAVTFHLPVFSRGKCVVRTAHKDHLGAFLSKICVARTAHKDHFSNVLAGVFACRTSFQAENQWVYRASGFTHMPFLDTHMPFLGMVGCSVWLLHMLHMGYIFLQIVL